MPGFGHHNLPLYRHSKITNFTTVYHEKDNTSDQGFSRQSSCVLELHQNALHCDLYRLL